MSDLSDAILEHEDALAPFIADGDPPFASDQVLNRVMTRAQRAKPVPKQRRLRASGPASLKTRAVALVCALALVGAMGAAGLLTNAGVESKPGVEDNAALVQYAAGTPCLLIELEIAFLQQQLQVANVNVAPIQAQINALLAQLDLQCGAAPGPGPAPTNCSVITAEILFLRGLVQIGPIATRLALLQNQLAALGCPPVP